MQAVVAENDSEDESDGEDSEESETEEPVAKVSPAKKTSGKSPAKKGEISKLYTIILNC